MKQGNFLLCLDGGKIAISLLENGFLREQPVYHYSSIIFKQFETKHKPSQLLNSSCIPKTQNNLVVVVV